MGKQRSIKTQEALKLVGTVREDGLLHTAYSAGVKVGLKHFGSLYRIWRKEKANSAKA